MAAILLATRRWFAATFIIVLGYAASASTLLQESEPLAGPLSSTARFRAPYTATATTTVAQRGANGARMQWRTNSRLYRDSFGRVRIEYGAGTARMVLLVPNPYAQTDRLFLIDESRQTVELCAFPTFSRLFNNVRTFAIPVAPRRFYVFDVHDVRESGNGILEDLGDRESQGLHLVGRRFSDPTGAIDEQWESPDLGIVVSAHHSDANTTIEFTLTDVRRAEPPDRLFTIPPDLSYSILNTLQLDRAPTEQWLRQ